MSLRIIKSSLFDQPGGTTQRMQLKSIVHERKQRLQMNSQSTSRLVSTSVQLLKAAQARSIEKLATVAKNVKFHSVYENYQRSGKGKEGNLLQLGEKLALFRKGLHYRCSERPKRVREHENIRLELQEYFERRREEEAQEKKIAKQLSQGSRSKNIKARI